jgi:hypothetical protein
MGNMSETGYHQFTKICVFVSRQDFDLLKKLSNSEAAGAANPKLGVKSLRGLI